MSQIPNFNPTLISTTGATALAPVSWADFAITAVGVAAITLSAPQADGVELIFVDEGGHAHTITATGLVNGTHNVLTFGGTVGNAVTLRSRNGFWWTLALIGITIA